MNRRRALIAGPGAWLLGGCTLVTQEPVAPMVVQRDAATTAATAAETAKTLLVLLPGAFDLAADFVAQGFVSALRESGAAAVQVARPEAHLGYYVWETFLPRLREDVILPARQRGQRIWLAGISLGGYGALACAMRHGNEVTGVLAIAPWLGRRELQRDILAAGGARAWRASTRPGADKNDDLDQQLWLWLSDPAPPAVQPSPPLYLSFGTDDRLAGIHEAMAALLPAERVDRVPGGHDWPAWRLAWSHWLARGLLRA